MLNKPIKKFFVWFLTLKTPYNHVKYTRKHHTGINHNTSMIQRIERKNEENLNLPKIILKLDE